MHPRRSLIAAVAVTGVAVATVLAVAPSSNAVVPQVAVGSTVNGVPGGPTYIGKPTTLGLTLTNNSATKAKLGAFTIQVPAGVGAAALGAVSPGTWTETKLGCGKTPNCSALILVTPKSPLSSALIPVGGSVTAFLSFTPPTAGTFAFPILGIGLGNGVYTASGSVVVSAATALKITSIVDTSQNPALQIPAATQTFKVSFQALDSYSNPASQPGLSVALSAGGPGALSPASPTTTSDANGQGSFTVTYSEGATAVPFTVSSPPLTPDTLSTDISGAGTSANGTPKVAIPPFSAGAGTANLPNGSYGPVFLTQDPCPDSTSCVDVTLDGTFSGAQGELYTNEHPATVTLLCPASPPEGSGIFACPHNDANAEPSSAYDYNHGIFDTEEEQVEDFLDYPVRVSLKINGEYTEPAPAPSCTVLSGDSESNGTGSITNPDAHGFCVDVYAITRAGNSFHGDLTIPILFVEDPKMRLP